MLSHNTLDQDKLNKNGTLGPAWTINWCPKGQIRVDGGGRGRTGSELEMVAGVFKRAEMNQRSPSVGPGSWVISREINDIVYPTGTSRGEKRKKHRREPGRIIDLGLGSHNLGPRTLQGAERSWTWTGRAEELFFPSLQQRNISSSSCATASSDA